MHVPPSLVAAFVAHVLLLGALFLFGVRRAAGPRAAAVAAAGLGLWLSVTFVIGASGLLANTSATPPLVMRFIAGATLLTVVLAFSPLGARLATLPWTWIVGFQGFRVTLELLLHALCRAGVLPVQMTFEGRNVDVLTGLSALVVALLASRRTLTKAVYAAWNVLGVALLVNIVVIAALSVPGPLRRFSNEPPNTIILEAPFFWLPTVLVMAALFGHLLVLRKLLVKSCARVSVVGPMRA